jgi:hypothetical protein
MFENKSLTNDLSQQFNEMNAENVPQNFFAFTPKQAEALATIAKTPVGAVLPVIKSAGSNLTTSVIGTKEKPTELSEVIITAPPKKRKLSKSTYYILGGALLIFLIYKYVKK